MLYEVITVAGVRQDLPNGFRRVVAWSMETGEATPLTDAMADATDPSWDRDGRHLYFLASTDLALGSSWASTSAILSQAASYGAYVAVLRADDPTPFPPESDDESVEEEGRDEPGEPDEEAPADEPAEADEAAGPEVRIDS